MSTTDQPWEVNHGTLRIDEVDIFAQGLWSFRQLECAVQRLLDLILESGYEITLTAILITHEFAADLLEEGVLTEHMLERWTPDYGGITVRMEIADMIRVVSIMPATVHCGYDFIVYGHPSGAVRVHDGVADAEAFLALEPITYEG